MRHETKRQDTRERGQETRKKICETRDVRKETWDRRRETGDVRQETGGVRQETWDRSCDTGDMRLDMLDRRRETGDMIQEHRRQEIGDKRQEQRDRRQNTGDKRQITRDKRLLYAWIIKTTGRCSRSCSLAADHLSIMTNPVLYIRVGQFFRIWNYSVWKLQNVKKIKLTFFYFFKNFIVTVHMLYLP